MSGILAFAEPTGARCSLEEAAQLLRCIPGRGSDCSDVAESGPVVLGVIRDYWEEDDSVAGAARVARLGPFHLVSDAALYHRERLRQQLEPTGTFPSSLSPSDLLTASLQAWGIQGLQHVEGDYAFVAWDEASRTLTAARDPFGTRSLFFRILRGSMVISSTPHVLVELDRVPPPFDPEGALRSLLSQPGGSSATAWNMVREVPPGHFLQVRLTGQTEEAWIKELGDYHLKRFWVPGPDLQARRHSKDDAPRALAQCLEDAVVTRVPHSGAALAMSGGYDSTALAGAYFAGEPRSSAPLHVLSFRYDAEDPANEDDFVTAVARTFDLPIHWVETRNLGLLDRSPRQVSRRSFPEGHIHESQNRALARAAREQGVRVLLNGNGGDNLFFGPPLFMADLLRQGRWLDLRRFFRSRGFRGFGAFRDFVLRPAIPLTALDAMERLRRRPINSRPFERPLPPWIKAPGHLMAEMRQRDRAAYAEAILVHHRSAESRFRAWFASDPMFARVCAALFDLVRDEGVELRSPFYDQRVVSFALARPIYEMTRPGEVKPLLRDSMKGRLPDRVIAPRLGGKGKTGMIVEYSRRRLRSEIQGRLEALDSSWMLERLGLTSASLYNTHLQANLAGDHTWEAQLIITLAVEEWLQQQARLVG